MTIPADINSALATICDHLSQRTAVLFLGAGVNHGTRNASGRDFPLGAQLATSISSDLLSLDDSNLTLEDAAEIARYQFGEKALNDYLYQLFESFNPTNAHFAAVQAPWDVIYTTNFDLLIEKAAASPGVNPAGTIQPVFATTTDLTPFREADILYYKLHGSIDFANSPEGRLILTKNDYRRYTTFRKPLFQRLKTDLSAKTFVFVG